MNKFINLERLEPLLSPIFPGKCFDSLVVNLDVKDVACLKVVLSKCLGYGMIVGGSLVKLPQILKIVAAKSAMGLSLPSVFLDLTGVTATTAYNYDQNYPFSSYGEGFFLMFETALILLLSLHYSGRSLFSFLFGCLYLALCFALGAKMVPSGLLWWGQLLAAPVVITGRLWQALENYRAGNTGQQSLITFSLLLLGCMARIFTSITETGDTIVILSYSLATFANAVLVTQVIWYWEATNKFLAKHAATKAKKEKKTN